MFPLFCAIWAGEPTGVTVPGPEASGGLILKQIPFEVEVTETMPSLRASLSRSPSFQGVADGRSGRLQHVFDPPGA